MEDVGRIIGFVPAKIQQTSRVTVTYDSNTQFLSQSPRLRLQAIVSDLDMNSGVGPNPIKMYI